MGLKSVIYDGQIQFKKKWGVELRDCSYYLIAPPGASATAKVRTVKTSSSYEGQANARCGVAPPPLTARVLANTLAATA
jgi:hypothetical protein